jgi:hypothetical protein
MAGDPASLGDVGWRFHPGGAPMTRATGPKVVRGDQPSGPRSEPIHGSNVISFADHHHRSLPDDRSTSGAREAAAPFIREFAAWCLAIGFVLSAALFVSATVVIYAALVS